MQMDRGDKAKIQSCNKISQVLTLQCGQQIMRKRIRKDKCKGQSVHLGSYNLEHFKVPLVTNGAPQIYD